LISCPWSATAYLPRTSGVWTRASAAVQHATVTAFRRVVDRLAHAATVWWRGLREPWRTACIVLFAVLVVLVQIISRP
jgi:hypothetical protein